MISNIMETSCENSKTSITDSFGCQAIIRDNEKCGEIKSLDILKEFQHLYEQKINEIEEDCNCPATKTKNQILRDWVKDLTEQNTLLVQVVEELEHEASERVALLEDKLKNSSKTSFEIMQTLQDYDAQNISNQSDFIKKIMHYQSDLNNLIEFIRRLSVDSTFNFDGLHFYNITTDEIYNYGEIVSSSTRSDQKQKELEDTIDKLNMELKMYKDKQHEYEEEKKNRDKLLQEQNDKIDRLTSVIDRCSNNMPDRQRLLEDLHELRTELKSRNEDFNRLEIFETGDSCKEYETFKIQIAGLEEQNGILRQTISNANAELNELRGIVEKYSRSYEDEKNKITGSVQNLFRKLRLEENVLKYGDNQFISIKEQIIGSTYIKDINEIQTAVQNYNQNINSYNYSDTLLLLRTANTSESLGTENDSQDSDNDFNRTMYLLKAEINKMVRLISEQTIDTFKSNVDDVATTMNDLTNKDKLIRNKDEMIKIQNDSLALAQDELKMLQNKVYELEADREIKIQEIKNLQQALSMNQNSIVELKNSLRNSEEKGNNIQQTDNVKKILNTNEILEDDLTYMNSEMKEVSKELKILQKLLKKNDTSSNENMTLTKSIQILQEHSESLVEQLKLAQDQVSRELDINQSSSLQILDLQKQLDLKTIELQRNELDLKDAKSKLNVSLRRIQEYEKRCAYLEKQLNDLHNEQKNEEIINTDINCLKQKIEMLSKILSEKSTEILQLHSDLSSKSDTVTKIITENTQLQENNAKMALNVMNLEKQLCLYKTRCEEINSKYLICQSELETLKVITSSQEDIKKDRSLLVAKLETTRKEENKLNKIINDMEQELKETKYMLKQKDDNLSNMNAMQQEIISLKEDINRVTKIRNKVLTENQKLQDQISKVNMTMSQYENRNIHISEQLEKCIDELNSLQSAKSKLEERNIQLETEISHLQRVFGELNQEIRYKHESVINLEHELSETKCSRDEICAESRIVVNNVRAWLEEHKRLNISLNNTVKEKNMIIEELTLERNLLLKNIKEVCERYEILTEELHICRQYLAELDPDEKAFTKTGKSPFKRSVHTWGSQGSNSYDSNSPMIIEHDYDYSSIVPVSYVSRGKLHAYYPSK